MDNEKAIKNMLKCIYKILEYTNGVSSEQFFLDLKLQDACLMNLTQIGENVVNIDDAFMEKHNDIIWKQIKGMRNVIVHDYDGVNMTIVWDIIEKDLPKLKSQLEKIL